MPTNSNYIRISVKLNVLHEKMSDAATKTIGFTKNSKNYRVHNHVVESLSNQQKELCLSISSKVNNEKVRELNTQRKRILHDIANMLNEGKNRELVNVASEIDKCHNDKHQNILDNQIYQQKTPTKSNLSTENLRKAGRNVTEPNAVYNIIRDHFKAHFNDPKES